MMKLTAVLLLLALFAVASAQYGYGRLFRLDLLDLQEKSLFQKTNLIKHHDSFFLLLGMGYGYGRPMGMYGPYGYGRLNLHLLDPQKTPTKFLLKTNLIKTFDSKVFLTDFLKSQVFLLGISIGSIKV